MYAITECLDGRFLCECRIQDGTERWHEPTRDHAVESLIKGARIMNGSTITEADIDFSRQVAHVQPALEAVATVAERRPDYILPAGPGYDERGNPTSDVAAMGVRAAYLFARPQDDPPESEPPLPVCYDRPTDDVGPEKVPRMSWAKRVLLWAAERID